MPVWRRSFCHLFCAKAALKWVWRCVGRHRILYSCVCIWVLIASWGGSWTIFITIIICAPHWHNGFEAKSRLLLLLASPLSLTQSSARSPSVPRVFWPLMNAARARWRRGRGGQRGSAHTPHRRKHHNTQPQAVVRWPLSTSADRIAAVSAEFVRKTYAKSTHAASKLRWKSNLISTHGSCFNCAIHYFFFFREEYVFFSFFIVVRYFAACEGTLKD